jgi:hypothetical protein
MNPWRELAWVGDSFNFYQLSYLWWSTERRAQIVNVNPARCILDHRGIKSRKCARNHAADPHWLTACGLLTSQLMDLLGGG